MDAPDVGKTASGDTGVMFGHWYTDGLYCFVTAPAGPRRTPLLVKFALLSSCFS